VKVKGYRRRLDDVFRIATFAALGGVSAKVLRDYDAAGLFRPAWVDRTTGYRMYSPAQLPELRRILALRDLGVGLDEIRGLMVAGAEIHDILARRRSALELARREVDRRLATLGIALEDGGAAGPGDIVVRDIPGELVATLDVAAVGGDEGRAFYELEQAIRDAGVRAPRPPGSIVEADRMEVFVPVRRAAAGLITRRLPAVRAATILHHGAYSGLEARRETLRRWIAASGLSVAAGERVLYLQFGAERELRVPPPYVVERAIDLVTELQQPLV
jgi:DNA-binding transcriptional MerR regulator